MTYLVPVHTVVETPEYLAAADRAGMTEEDRDAALDTLQKTPALATSCRRLEDAGKSVFRAPEAAKAAGTG